MFLAIRCQVLSWSFRCSLASRLGLRYQSNCIGCTECNCVQQPQARYLGSCRTSISVAKQRQNVCPFAESLSLPASSLTRSLKLGGLAKYHPRIKEKRPAEHVARSAMQPAQRQHRWLGVVCLICSALAKGLPIMLERFLGGHARRQCLVVARLAGWGGCTMVLAWAERVPDLGVLFRPATLPADLNSLAEAVESG